MVQGLLLNNNQIKNLFKFHTGVKTTNIIFFYIHLLFDFYFKFKGAESGKQRRQEPCTTSTRILISIPNKR